MGLMILADAQGSVVLLALLLASLGLTYWETREREFDRAHTGAICSGWPLMPSISGP